jgi:hypothetical protein
MTETENAAPARVPVRYLSDDPAPVALPGYLSPVPGVVAPGDVTVVDAAYFDELVDSGRFEEAPAAEAVTLPTLAEHADMTKAELGEILGLDDAQVKAARHSDLVADADARAVVNPQPVGSAPENDGIDTPPEPVLPAGDNTEDVTDSE